MIDGRDLREMPLAARKTRLAHLAEAVDRLHYVEHLRIHGEALFAKAVELDLEGIVAKRADSPYRAGRQPSWVKIKNPDYWRRKALRSRR
jgi:bifunctional non-homologous end joining protein LigD